MKFPMLPNKIITILIETAVLVSYPKLAINIGIKIGVPLKFYDSKYTLYHQPKQIQPKKISILLLLSTVLKAETYLIF